MADNEPVSRRTRSKTPITPKSEREVRAQLRAEVSDRLQRSSNAEGPSKPSKRRKKDDRSTKRQKGVKDASVNNLQNMPDEMLIKIVDFVAASDGHYLYSAKKITEKDIRLPFSHAVYEDEELLSMLELENTRLSLKKISSPPSAPVASLQGTGLLLRSLSTASKRLNRFCRDFLGSALIDADLFGVTEGLEVQCILWMIRGKLCLSRVRAKSSDAFLLASLLIHCDTTELKACDVKLTGDSFIRTAWLKEFESEVVDLVADTTTLTSKSHNEMLWDLDIKRNEYVHADMSQEEFYKIVAAECPFLEILSMRMEFDPYSRRLDSRYASIMSSPSLKYIDLNVCLSSAGSANIRRNQDHQRQVPVILYSNLTKAIRLAPNLRGLRLGHTPYINDRYGLQIDSESLELIDMVDVSKNCFVLRCKCPKLQNFMIKGFTYPTGLLPNGFDLSQDWWMPRWDSNSLLASHGFIGLEVPSDCIVHLKGYAKYSDLF